MKIYEQENPYQKVGFSRNPFSMVLEPEKPAEIAFQREANRIYSHLEKNPQSSFVVWLDPKALVEAEIAFYSYLFRSFLLAPEDKWFVFDIPGTALRARGSLTGFEAIVGRIFEKNAPRIFYSYLISKLEVARNAGSLKNKLASFENVDSWMEEVYKTKGEVIAETLYYQPPELEEDKDTAAGEEVSENESEANEAEKEKKKEERERKAREIEQKLKQKKELKSFFLRAIEIENISNAVKTALKTSVNQGVEMGFTSFLPRDAKQELIGILKLLDFSYSRKICFMTGVGDIPFLEEDDLIEYTSLVAEQEQIVKRYGSVCYVIKPRDRASISELVSDKPEAEVSLFPEILEDSETKDDEWFKKVSLYMVGAFEGLDKEFLKEVEKASRSAFEESEGEWIDALKLMELAFDEHAKSGKPLSQVILKVT